MPIGLTESSRSRYSLTNTADQLIRTPKSFLFCPAVTTRHFMFLYPNLPLWSFVVDRHLKFRAEPLFDVSEILIIVAEPLAYEMIYSTISLTIADRYDVFVRCQTSQKIVCFDYSMYEPSFTSFEKGPSVEKPQANFQLQTLFIFNQYLIETNIASTVRYNHYLILYASIGLKYHFHKGTVPSCKV